MAERPVELMYALDERPPWLQLLGLGFQHVAVICPYLVMVALVAEAAKLPREAAQSAVGLANDCGRGYLINRSSQPSIFRRAWQRPRRSGYRRCAGW